MMIDSEKATTRAAVLERDPNRKKPKPNARTACCLTNGGGTKASGVDCFMMFDMFEMFDVFWNLVVSAGE